MTENQEKELFNTLGTLVTGVRKIQFDVEELKTDMVGVKQALNRLEAKTDTIAATVMANGKRLDNVEKDIEDLRSEVH